MKGAMGGERPGARVLTAPAVVAAVLVAIALRGAVGTWLNVEHAMQRGFPFYGHMAQSFLAGEGLKWEFYEGLGPKLANRAPLYPLTLAAIWTVLGRGALVTVWAQSILGGLACLVPAALGARWGGRRAAVAAGWIAALWPYSVVIDSGMVEHVVFAPLCVLAGHSLMLATRRPGGILPVLAGVVAGLAALARLTYGLVMPFSALVLLMRRGGLRGAMLFAVGAALALAPWVIRNQAVVGRAVIGTDGGRALWLSNAPGTFSHYPAGSIDDSERELYRRMDPAVLAELRALGRDELAQEARFKELALGNIADHPGDVAWGALRKAAAQWSAVYNPGPAGVVKRLVHAVTFLLLLGCVLVAVVRIPAVRADLPVLLALAAGFTAGAMLFWGQPRYLAPIHGLGVAAAGALCAATWRRE